MKVKGKGKQSRSFKVLRRKRVNATRKGERDDLTWKSDIWVSVIFVWILIKGRWASYPGWIIEELKGLKDLQTARSIVIKMNSPS